MKMVLVEQPLALPGPANKPERIVNIVLYYDEIMLIWYINHQLPQKMFLDTKFSWCSSFLCPPHHWYHCLEASSSCLEI